MNQTCSGCGGAGTSFSLQGEEGRCPSCDGHGNTPSRSASPGTDSYGASEMRCIRCHGKEFNLNWKGNPRCARCGYWC